MSWLLSPAAATMSLADFADTDFTGLAVNDMLYWDGANWIDTAGLLTWDGSNLSATNIGGIAEGDLLDKTADEILSGQYSFGGGATKFVKLFNGVDLRCNAASQVLFYNSVDTLLAQIGATGSDLSIANLNMTDFYITGFTTINLQDPVIITGALTATSYGGITEANLVDKTAAEAITGDWSFVDGILLVDDDGATGVTIQDAANTNKWYIGTSGAANDDLIFYDFDSALAIIEIDDTTNVVNFAVAGIATDNIVSLAATFPFTGASFYTFDNDVINTGGGFVADGASTSAMTGRGIVTFMDNTSGIGRFGAYNWDTAAWQPVEVHGSTVNIEAASGVTATGTLSVTGDVTLDGDLTIAQTGPNIFLQDTNATADEGNWIVTLASDSLRLQTASDAAPTVGVQNVFDIGPRAGTTINTVAMIDTALRLDARTGGGSSLGGLYQKQDNSGSAQVIWKWWDELNSAKWDKLISNVDSIQYRYLGGASEVFLEFNINKQVRVRDGVVFRVYDATDTDYMEFSETGAISKWTSNTNVMQIDPGGSYLGLVGGAVLRVYDTANADYVGISHDGTDAEFDFTNTTNANFNNLTALRALDGAAIQAFASGNAHSIGLRHDGTNAYLETGGTASHILIQPSAAKSVVVQGAGLLIQEQAAADANIAGYGQHWTYNTAPNRPYFDDDSGVSYPLQFAKALNVSEDTADVIDWQYMNGVAFMDGASSVTYTLEAVGVLTFEVGSYCQFINAGSNTMVIAEGATTTLYILDGSAVTDSTGSVTVAAGGYATVYRHAAGTYYVFGAGIT